jgi:hypothetical protein
MSGPLASWVGEHSQASWKGRAVVKEYALAARHDGTPAADVTLDDLEHRTRHSRTTVKAGRREAVRLRELVELERPGKGRGYPGRYRVAFTLCPAEAGCWSCSILAELLAGRGRVTPPSGKGKGSRERQKGAPQERKGARHAPTTVTETGPPTGGAVSHPESNGPRPPDAAEPAPMPAEVWAVLDQDPADKERRARTRARELLAEHGRE